MNTMAGEVTDRFGKINQFSSGAIIIDPLGQVVARTMQNDNKEKMLIATIDTDLTKYIPRWERPKASVKRDPPSQERNPPGEALVTHPEVYMTKH